MLIQINKKLKNMMGSGSDINFFNGVMFKAIIYCRSYFIPVLYLGTNIINFNL